MSITIGKIFDLTVQKFPDKEALYDVKKKCTLYLQRMECGSEPVSPCPYE